MLPKSQGSNKILIQPSSNLFNTEQEHRYFALFSDKIAAEISPYFNPDVLSRMILQACASEPSIRHASIALGALGKTFETAQSGRWQSGGVTIDQAAIGPPGGRISPKMNTKEATSHHQYALEQYDKAIRRMRLDILGGKQSLRTALITCIVIICFEALHGNHNSATAQLQTGIGLVQEWKREQNDSFKHPLGFSSPAPDIIEDFLVQTFGRLEIQTMSFLDSRPYECHLILKEEGKETVQQMPTTFISIDQARIYLDLIMRRLMHFIAAISYSSTNHTGNESPSVPFCSTRCPRYDFPQLPNESPDIDRCYRAPLPWLDIHIPTPTTGPIPTQIAEQENLIHELVDWAVAFETLLIKSIANAGRQRISALTLSIAVNASLLAIRAAFITTETGYDIFEPEFRTIVAQSSVLLQSLEHSSPDKGPTLAFAIDLSVLTPLYLTVTKCRISDIRKNALWLLVRYPRREGLWDSVTTAAIGSWVMEIEEKGEVDGFIPEEARVRKAGINFDLIQRRATMTCLQLDKEVGEYVQRSKEITW